MRKFPSLLIQLHLKYSKLLYGKQWDERYRNTASFYKEAHPDKGHTTPVRSEGRVIYLSARRIISYSVRKAHVPHLYVNMKG